MHAQQIKNVILFKHKIFKKHIEDTHPSINSNVNPPEYTIIIEADISSSVATNAHKKIDEHLRQQADRGFARLRLCTNKDGNTNNLVLYTVRNDTLKKEGNAPRATDY
jgi:hypothetical protein